MRQVKRFAGRDVRGTVYSADALNLLSSIEDESATLVFLDPPFNLGKHYDCNIATDKRPKIEYEEWLKHICDQAIRVLAPGGTLFLYHMPVWAMRVGAYIEQSLEFRHWIAVSMKNGFARGRRLYPAHYALLYFTKGPPKYFRRPKVQAQKCRHCGDYVKDYGGYLPIIRRKGINLSDLWEDISPVRHANRKSRLQNELPQTLMSRVIRIGGRRGTLYVDPFSGAGSGALEAVQRGMRFVVGDIVDEFAELTASRIEQFKSLNKVRRRRGRQ